MSYNTIAQNNMKVRCTVCGQCCQSWIECDRNVAAAARAEAEQKKAAKETK